MFHPGGPSLRELAEQALSSTERGYDLLAPKFDHTPFRTPDAVVSAVAESLPHEFDRGLDLCCGTGVGIEMLRPRCRKCVAGLDFSRGMLSIARMRFSAVGGTPVGLVRGNALSLPFGAEFDVVICLGALGHILPRDQRRFIAEAARVLKPDGCFVFLSAYMPPPWSPRYLLGRGFNAAMHARNALVSPPFVMYYLTFLLPAAQLLLEEAGLDVLVTRPAGLGRGYGHLRLVIATRRS